MSPRTSTEYNRPVGDQDSAMQSKASLQTDEEKGYPADESTNDLPSPSAGTSPEQKPEQAAPPASQPSPPPNGGTIAWLQVFGSFSLFFNTWGILNTFGVYQTYYESGQLFQATSSNISWIGSIQAFLVVVIGCVSGPIFDRGYLRSLLLFGSFMIVFGHMMLSLCHTFWQALLAQGFVIGIGGGCLFIPAVAIMPAYFTTKLGLVIGLAAAGSSLGGVIYPIVFYRLIDQIGFGWSVRVIGFMALATLLLPVCCMKMRLKPAKVRAVIDWTAFTDLHYMTFVVGGLIGFIGLYTGFFYISYFGAATGITDASMSFYLVPILNAASVFGRTIPNYVSDKTGPLNLVGPGALIVSIVLYCFLATYNLGGIVVEAIFFGFFSGIFIALPPVIFVALTPDKSKIGTRMGMGYAMFGLGILAGGPGAGGILQRNGEQSLDWTGTWVYGGTTMLASGIIFCILRFIKGGFAMKKM